MTNYGFSTKNQGNSGLGLKSQKDSVTSYIKNVNGILINSYEEIASGKTDNRDKLQLAIQQCATEGAIMIVKKLDRLSRGGFKIAVQLQELGIEYIESDSPNDSQLLKDIKLSIAKDEREKISERTKAALQQLKKQGVQLGNKHNFTNAGRLKGAYNNMQRAKTNENNKRAKAYVNVLNTSSFSLREIATKLNEAGFKTSRGMQFQATSVKRLLDAA